MDHFPICITSLTIDMYYCVRVFHGLLSSQESTVFRYHGATGFPVVLAFKRVASGS